MKRLLTTMGARGYEDELHRLTRIPTVPLSELLDRIGRPVDLLQMDVQGVEGDILEAARQLLTAGTIRTLLVGTHGSDIHAHCAGVLSDAGHRIVDDDPSPTTQPDGMLVATRQQD